MNNAPTSRRSTRKFAAIVAAVAMGATALTLSLAGVGAPASTESACMDAGGACNGFLEQPSWDPWTCRYVQCGPGGTGGGVSHFH